jgi:hypothetical protein
MLVDTPGISGAREMNSMLMDFLPNAFGFIFVIDASRAGGVEDDRVWQNFILRALYFFQLFKDLENYLITVYTFFFALQKISQPLRKSLCLEYYSSRTSLSQENSELKYCI